MILHILATLLLLLTYPAHFGFAADPTREVVLLGGTILSIDQEALTITIQMPSGESQALPVITRRLLQGLGTGDHVSFEMDEENRLIKITKLPVDPAN